MTAMSPNVSPGGGSAEGTAAPPRVSVVIVNWNRLADLRVTLDYLSRQRYPDFETIVVDNGSTDGSVEELGERDDVRLVALGQNLGPAAARNAGAQAATGKYLFFLDSDALPAKHGFGKLVRRMEAEPAIGLIGCRITNFYSRRIDQWFYAQPYRTHGDREFETYSFSAAGAMVRAEAFRQAGGFWEELFIYNEEVDLSIRLIRAGYRVLYSPAVRVFHRVSPHGRAPGSAYYYYQTRNWIWIFYRYYPAPARWRKILIYIGVYLIKGAVSRKLWPCVEGLASGLCGRWVLRRFPEKLTRSQVRMLEVLNRRRRIDLSPRSAAVER